MRRIPDHNLLMSLFVPCPSASACGVWWGTMVGQWDYVRNAHACEEHSEEHNLDHNQDGR